MFIPRPSITCTVATFLLFFRCFMYLPVFGGRDGLAWPVETRHGTIPRQSIAGGYIYTPDWRSSIISTLVVFFYLASRARKERRAQGVELACFGGDNISSTALCQHFVELLHSFFCVQSYLFLGSWLVTTEVARVRTGHILT